MIIFDLGGILMKIITGPESIQGSNEWLDFRKDKIGASDAAIIVGVSPWCTRYQLWRRKIGLDLEQDDNPAMKRGRELEPLAREYLEKEWGHNFIPVVGQNEKYPWMIASFDAWSPDLDVYVEIKCPGPKDHELAKEGKIPEKYIPQLVHQMITCEKEKITYMSFDGSEGIFIDLSIYEFAENYLINLIKEEDEFYYCIMNLTQPELTDRDYTNRSDGEWIVNATAYIAAKKQENFWKKEATFLKERLELSCGGLPSKGAGITLSKGVRKGDIDLNLLVQETQIDIEKYRKPQTQYWRINVNNNN